MTTRPSFEQAIGDLTYGKRRYMGLLIHPEEGPVFLWQRHCFQIYRLLILHNGECWDEKNFHGCLLLKQGDDPEKTWYMLADENFNCQKTSFDEPLTQLVVYAIVLPNKKHLDNAKDEDAQNVPLCLKAVFSNSAPVVALVRDSNITRLWQLEIEALLNGYYHTNIHPKNGRGDII